MGTDDVAYGLNLVIDHGANLDQSLVDAACLPSVVEAKSLSHLAGLFEPSLHRVQSLKVLMWLSHRLCLSKWSIFHSIVPCTSLLQYFGESLTRELLRIPLPRTPVNKLPVNAPQPSGWHHGCCCPTAE